MKFFEIKHFKNINIIDIFSVLIFLIKIYFKTYFALRISSILK